MTLKETIILTFVAALSISLIGFENRYERETKEIIERIETVEGVSNTTFENVQKINCQTMYDARLCEPDYLVIPPYKKPKKNIKKTPQNISILKKRTSKETLWKENKDIIMNMIKDHEEFRATGYPDGCLEKVKKGNKCPEDKIRYSIGYGTIEKTRGEVISEKEGSLRMEKHLVYKVLPYVPRTVTDKGVFIALMDLGYNNGGSAVKKCTNFDGSLNVKNYQTWVNFEGRRNNGLERRKKATLIYSLSLMEI